MFAGSAVSLGDSDVPGGPAAGSRKSVDRLVWRGACEPLQCWPFSRRGMHLYYS